MGMQLGDSVAVNGVCLTVRQLTERDFQVEISSETLKRSNLGEIRIGSEVNLERPLTPGSRLGGHFVQGHVDGTSQVLSIESREGFGVMEIFYSHRIETVHRGKGIDFCKWSEPDCGETYRTVV